MCDEEDDLSEIEKIRLESIQLMDEMLKQQLADPQMADIIANINAYGKRRKRIVKAKPLSPTSSSRRSERLAGCNRNYRFAYCHACKRKTMEPQVRCKTGVCGPRTGSFCGKCLMRYGEDIEAALKDDAWSCLSCRNVCQCQTCRRKRKKVFVAPFQPSRRLTRSRRRAARPRLGRKSKLAELVETVGALKDEVAEVSRKFDLMLEVLTRKREDAFDSKP